ncbi:TetM/TetW/TetO/TetS family tetracycline resistance ribosomal protection protein [Phreatobacter oligotrophus]|uniref:Elongation factor G-like protein n=1 Tax=Phreatobacter oligotrophus TaxID=1122261 RepID=A0A2T4ZID7_9HYPH|nr:TetM/TetW/TetO/TetS family tetracycline resistance ribosomal protection protein [Phreatobacter oligotrophus]PTM61748.1 elongation factor G-like protein [Phreatobacter oligotrophus]
MRESNPVPWPLINLTLTPRTEDALERLHTALRILAAEDERLQISSLAPAEIQLGGVSEDHLDAAVDALRRVHGVEVMCPAPTVAFRETIARPMEVECRQRVGNSMLSLTIRVEPTASLSVTVSGEAVSLGAGDAVALREGIEYAVGNGPGWGLPVAGVAITVLAAETLGDPVAVRRVAETATREAIERGGIVLIEPILSVTVTAPDAVSALVVADLVRRRGQDVVRRQDGAASVVEADVPLINLMGYRNSLREISGGLATLTSRYARYRPAPPHLDDDPPPVAAMALRA